MTVYKLHQILTQAIKDGCSRMPIHIQKKTYHHPLESDGVCVLPVVSWYKQMVPQCDDDGGTKWNKDGTESQRACFILSGETEEDTKSREDDELRELNDRIEMQREFKSTSDSVTSLTSTITPSVSALDGIEKRRG